MSKAKLPEGWEEAPLESVAEVHDKHRVPLSSMQRSKIKGPYPYCGANGIIDHINKYIFDGEFILIAEDGGDFNKYSDSAYLMDGKFWVNNHAHILKAIEGKSTNKYLLYFLNYSDLNRYIVGSTRRKLNQDKLRSISVVLPPLPEQKAIASVLSTIDQDLEKVNAAIEKTIRTNKGLMQKLLSSKNGDMTTLADKKFFELIMGQSPPSFSYNGSNKGVPFLQGNAEFGHLYPKPVKRTTQPTKMAQKGDILISVRAPVGELNICDQDLCMGRGLGAIRVLKGSNLFYISYLKHIRKIIQNSSQGSTFKAITRSEINRIEVPLLPPEEQERIAKILFSVDERYILLKKKKSKLERIKKGVMDDLLTGKKRLKVE